MNAKGMRFETFLFLSTMYVLWTSCQAIPLPLIDLKNTLEQNVLDTMVTSACSPNEECWEWLPIQNVRENIAIIPEDLRIPRIPIRRDASSDVDPNTIIKSWGDNIPALDRTHIGNRLSKKGVLMSRSWGAGGMPFSVLYMSPHGPRGNHAGTQQPEVGKAVESSTPPVGHPNYRIALRNAAASHPRRQYSIIPQLFISYGWGPFGK